MDILVDTHILVWTLDLNSPLSHKHRELIKDINNRIVVSQISFMELAIKKSAGKLPDFKPTLDEVMATWLKNGYEVLSLTEGHIFPYELFPIILNIESHLTVL